MDYIRGSGKSGGTRGGRGEGQVIAMWGKSCIFAPDLKIKSACNFQDSQPGGERGLSSDGRQS